MFTIEFGSEITIFLVLPDKRFLYFYCNISLYEEYIWYDTTNNESLRQVTI